VQCPADKPLKHLAEWKYQRYFIERSNQEAKSELGWDELQAQKYLAWEHHLALTVLASWFVAQTNSSGPETIRVTLSCYNSWEQISCPPFRSLMCGSFCEP
jgi:hypothetical protein